MMTRRPPLALVVLVAVAVSATAAGTSLDSTTTNVLDRAEAAHVIVEAARTAKTYEDALKVRDLVAAMHDELTPEQQAALNAAEPNPPNFAEFAKIAPMLSGVDLAKAATRAQAENLGVEATAPPMAAHATPSEALFSFLQQEGAVLATEQDAQVRNLDALPTTIAADLTRTIDAFAAMEDAAQAAVTTSSTPDWGPTLGARLMLLDAVASLGDSIRPISVPLHNSIPVLPSEVDIPPFVRIDFSLMDDQYLENYVLSIDVGGNDHYLNNAGGTWIGNCDLPTYAGAAIDLGAGGDRYNDGAFRADSCGKNGGSNGGVGFLYDDLGQDTYGTWGLHSGINGGARGLAALGFLADPDGGEFRAGDSGTNGGGADGGVGLMLGTGSIYAGSWGTNGGATNAGLGMLVGGGYVNGGSFGSNGGAYGAGGTGFALGTGSWSAGGFGTNGGGSNAGAGTLVGPSYAWAWDYGTNGGADGLGSAGALYGAAAAYHGGSYGTNGGGSNGGRGTLIDSAASWMQAGSYGTNGGGYGLGSVGFTLGGGYVQGGGGGTNGGAATRAVGFLLAPFASSMNAQSQGTNGGAFEAGVGSLVGGSGSYTAGGTGTNGGSYAASSALLIGGLGGDHYQAGSEGTNGGAFAGGHGRLIDIVGNDVYGASGAGTNGCVVGVGSGLLLDVQGYDTYNGAPNQSQVPCGVGGVRIDVSPI